jgi:hypothetical protein
VLEVPQKGDQVSAAKEERLVHKHRAELGRGSRSPARERAPALAPSPDERCQAMVGKLFGGL